MQSALEILDVHPFLRPPSWRHMVARSLAEDGCTPDKVAQRDAWLATALDAETRRLAGTRPSPKDMRAAAAREARSLFLASRPGGWRWYAEALLCGGMSDNGIAEVLDLPFGPDAVLAFRRIYFDVDCYRARSGELSRTALEANVMSSSRSRVASLGSHDYLWKRVAIRFGAKAFLGFSRGDADEATRDYVMRMSSGRNLETALMFSENPAAVASVLGSDMANALLKMPEELKAAGDKRRAMDGDMAGEFEEYFKVMGPLIEAAQRVVTGPRLVTGVEVDAQGRGIQRITSGGRAMAALPAQTQETHDV